VVQIISSLHHEIAPSRHLLRTNLLTVRPRIVWILPVLLRGRWSGRLGRCRNLGAWGSRARSTAGVLVARPAILRQIISLCARLECSPRSWREVDGDTKTMTPAISALGGAAASRAALGLPFAPMQLRRSSRLAFASEVIAVLRDSWGFTLVGLIGLAVVVFSNRPSSWFLLRGIEGICKPA